PGPSPYERWSGTVIRRSELHHPAHAAHVGRATAGTRLLGGLGDDRLGREDVLADRRGVLERRAGDHGRIDDPGLDEVDGLAAVDVQAVALRGRADRVDDDGALEPGVDGELPERLLQGALHDRRAGLLVTAEGVQRELVGRGQQRDAAARDDALLEGRAGRLEGVLDAVLLLLHLGLGGSADLDHRNAARQLGEALLELLAVEVGVGVLDLLLDLLDARLDRVALAGTVDDRRRVLVDHDLAGAAELRHRGVLELQAHLLGDHLATGQDGDVLEHPLAAVAEARRLHGDGGERAAQLVDDDRGERLALDVLGHDQQRAAALDDRLEHGEDVLDRADLLVGDQDERLVEHRLHPLGVRDHVGRQVALVELHALGELELEAERLALLDVHDAVLADLVDRIGDDVADLRVARRDGGDAGDVALAVDLLRLRLDRLDDLDGGLLDAALQAHRV